MTNPNVTEIVVSALMERGHTFFNVFHPGESVEVAVSVIHPGSPSSKPLPLRPMGIVTCVQQSGTEPHKVYLTIQLPDFDAKLLVPYVPQVVEIDDDRGHGVSMMQIETVTWRRIAPL